MMYDLINCLIITVLIPDIRHNNQIYIHSVLIPYKYTFIVSRLIASILLTNSYEYIKIEVYIKKRFLEEYAKL